MSCLVDKPHKAVDKHPYCLENSAASVKWNATKAILLAYPRP